MASERLGCRIAVRSLVRTDAEVKVRRPEGHRQIAVEHAEMCRRVRRPDLPGGALDQRAERDLVPVPLEQVAKQLLEARLVGLQGEDLDSSAVGIGFELRASN